MAQKLLDGARNESLLNGLDEEDVVIVASILDGIQNPNTLPDAKPQIKASNAAPGLASIIYAASQGDTAVLHTLCMMAEHMSQTGGTIAEIAGVIRKLVNGERDIDQLSEKMSAQSRNLLVSIINDLGKLTPHQYDSFDL